ncbi:MAG TPA: glycosyltransferase, partial [Vicinamibacterales bacterium]|nr:glycosyltransferase [Vicinamibacterales bacterium]
APRSLVVSFSAGQRSSLDPRGRVIRLSSRRYVALRALAPLLERRGDVTHAFGAVDSWHLLRSVGRRPTLLTVALGGTPLPRLYGHVAMFAVQAPGLRQLLLEAGVPPERITLVYPGIDLGIFRDAPPPGGRFTVLFASTPANPAEFDDRGIPLIVDVARRCFDIEFVLLWRQWGALRAAEQALQALRLPPNVVVRHEDVADMAEEYARVHAVICCYANNFGKACPNAVMEALACGRPALVTSTVGLAGLVHDDGAGVVVPRDPDAVRAGLEALRSGYDQYRHRARPAAEARFDLARAAAAYKALYEKLA